MTGLFPPNFPKAHSSNNMRAALISHLKCLGGSKMSAFETATKFFHACESLQGWEGCKDYVADGAEFSAQCEPLVDIHTVEDYCEWMAGLGKGPLKGCV